MDPDPGKNDTDPDQDPAKKDQVPGKSSKSMKNAHNLCFVGVFYFTITCLQLIIQISVNKKLFYVFNGFS